jgi:putative transposase
MIAPEAGLSVSRQCALLGIARSSFYYRYYRPRPEAAEELDLLKRLDRIFINHPVYGSRRLQVALLREGISIGRRRVRRLMTKLGLWRSGRSGTPASGIPMLINRIFPCTMMISISGETARERYRDDGRRTSAIPKIDFSLRILPSPWGPDAAKRLGIEKRRRSSAPAARRRAR